MSTIEDPRIEPVPGSPDDPFRYGWRYVTVKRADGRVEVKTVPLTLRDLLFPQEEDRQMHFPSHQDDLHYLEDVFRARVDDDPTIKVLVDCRVRFDVPDLEPLGPDIAVFSNLAKDWDGGTLEVAALGNRPILVVEITSPDTRKNDFGPKKDYYHQAGVPLYIIVDARPNPKGRRVKLHGFRHAPGGYEPLPLDDRGRLWAQPLGIWMAIEGPRVVCFDGRTAERFADYKDVVQARAEAEARSAEAEVRAEAEARSRIEWKARGNALSRIADDAQARADAEARTREAESQLRIMAEGRASEAREFVETQARLIATQDRTLELEKQVRDVLNTRLQEAEARAEEGARARADIEARLSEMEAEIRRLRGEA
jgi:colicin import membrane protein